MLNCCAISPHLRDQLVHLLSYRPVATVELRRFILDFVDFLVFKVQYWFIVDLCDAELLRKIAGSV